MLQEGPRSGDHGTQVHSPFSSWSPPFLSRGLDRGTEHPQHQPFPFFSFFTLLHLSHLHFCTILKLGPQNISVKSSNLFPLFSTETLPAGPQKDPPSHSQPRDLDIPSFILTPSDYLIKTHPWEPTPPSEGLGAPVSPSQGTCRKTPDPPCSGSAVSSPTHGHSPGETRSCVPLAQGFSNFPPYFP